MPADATIVPLRSDEAEAPAARRDAPREQPQRPPREQPEQPARVQPARPIEKSSEPDAPQSPGWRRWIRPVSFALLPLALIASGRITPRLVATDVLDFDRAAEAIAGAGFKPVLVRDPTVAPPERLGRASG